jgi:hypothetical protein
MTGPAPGRAPQGGTASLRPRPWACTCTTPPPARPPALMGCGSRTHATSAWLFRCQLLPWGGVEEERGEMGDSQQLGHVAFMHMLAGERVCFLVMRDDLLMSVQPKSMYVVDDGWCCSRSTRSRRLGKVYKDRRRSPEMHRLPPNRRPLVVLKHGAGSIRPDVPAIADLGVYHHHHHSTVKHHTCLLVLLTKSPSSPSTSRHGTSSFMNRWVCCKHAVYLLQSNSLYPWSPNLLLRFLLMSCLSINQSIGLCIAPLILLWTRPPRLAPFSSRFVPPLPVVPTGFPVGHAAGGPSQMAVTLVRGSSAAHPRRPSSAPWQGRRARRTTRPENGPRVDAPTINGASDAGQSGVVAWSAVEV